MPRLPRRKYKHMGITIAQMAFEMGRSPKYLKTLGYPKVYAKYKAFKENKMANEMAIEQEDIKEAEVVMVQLKEGIQENAKGFLKNMISSYEKLDYDGLIKEAREGNMQSVAVLKVASDLGVSIMDLSQKYKRLKSIEKQMKGIAH